VLAETGVICRIGLSFVDDEVHIRSMRSCSPLGYYSTTMSAAPFDTKRSLKRTYCGGSTVA
jgi:hypothetical protein